MSTVMVLGAGASRGVSYRSVAAAPSFLDSDFFQLLRHAQPHVRSPGLRNTVLRLLRRAESLQAGAKESFERAFYTLHLRAVVAELVGLEQEDSDVDVVEDFARCVQYLLRRAHRTHVCSNHTRLFAPLCEGDVILSFNYDLVAERALGKKLSTTHQFTRDLYCFADPKPIGHEHLIKLHGSSNWKQRSVSKRSDDWSVEVLTRSWDDLKNEPGYRGHKGEGTLFPILLPFWDKKIESRPWSRMWRNAHSALRDAQALIVFGYSLPPTDIKAVELFRLSIGRLRRLTVIDPEPRVGEQWRSVVTARRFTQYLDVGDYLRDSE